MAAYAKKKIIILVKHGLYDPWIQIAQNGQNETWLLGKESSDYLVVHFYGLPLKKFGLALDRFHEWLRWKNRISNYIQRLLDFVLLFPLLRWIPTTTLSNLINMRGEEIQVKVFDSYVTLKWKQIGAYKYILDNFDFDFLYETNTSSYIRIQKLIDVTSQLPKSNVYAGLKPWESANFISGASRLTSRDVIERVISKRHLWDLTVLEDVAFGKLANRLGLNLIELESCDLTSLQKLSNFNRDELRNHFHFRAKSGSLEDRKDIDVMRALFKKLND